MRQCACHFCRESKATVEVICGILGSSGHRSNSRKPLRLPIAHRKCSTPPASCLSGCTAHVPVRISSIDGGTVSAASRVCVVRCKKHVRLYLGCRADRSVRITSVERVSHAAESCSRITSERLRAPRPPRFSTWVCIIVVLRSLRPSNSWTVRIDASHWKGAADGCQSSSRTVRAGDCVEKLSFLATGRRSRRAGIKGRPIAFARRRVANESRM